jgi:carbonic anhydrase
MFAPFRLSTLAAALVLALASAGVSADILNVRPAKIRAENAREPAAVEVVVPISGAASAAKAPHQPTPATPAAPADPLEVLRQRLTGRLTATKAGESTSLHEVRVVTRSEPPPAARPAPRPAAPTAAKAAGAALLAAPGAGAWSYQGPAGPQTWGGLKPEFNLCGNGQRQSPIDIRGGLAVDLEPVAFHYQPSRFGVIDNGHTVQANLGAGNHIELGGKRYELVQMHFHRPSEERIDGRQFEMSVHLVHKDEQGRLAVVAVLLDKGLQPQPAVQKVWNNLPLEKGEENAARVPLDLAELLPTDRRYYTYMGSMTTPPCSEGVQWVVMRQPVAVSAEQIELFARIYPMNARPLQQQAGRRILQSQ